MNLPKLTELTMKLNITVRFDLKQQVNQWLCIALLATVTFVVTIYYVSHKAQAIGNNFVGERLLYE